MSSANTVDAAAQAGAPLPQQQSDSPPQQQTTQTQTTQTTQQPQPAGLQSPTAPAAPTGANNTYICQWVDCGEPTPNAESLYEHVCEKHVGRKSTNNLNLTCSWGNCHTTTVKRDHITSHIRVHVPLKPHKCDLCGKSFKRPQDLKKHVKTHAEDPGAMMRGPHDGVGANRQHQNGYGNMAPQGRMGQYPDAYGGMPGSGVGYGYPGQPGGMGHYAPTAAHTGGPGHYGQVYYPAATTIGNHAAFDKGSAFNSLDHLFGAIKNRQFDPSNYQEVSQHLMGLQGVQLPVPMNGGYDQGGNGGGVYGPAPAYHAQNLPPFSNLRSKQDLTFIEDYLNQMTQAAYENSGAMSANAITTGFVPRHSNSPPSMHLPSAHSQDMHMTPGGNSPPALTPGSSTMSYTSGHSPTSAHSHVVSPTSAHPSYPTLPTVTDGPNAGMPASTLGQQYDHDLRRRWSGGNLQRAQTARRNSHEMDIDKPETAGETAKGKKAKAKAKRDANIDPLLAGESTSSESGASERTVTPPREGLDQDEAWVENMRLLEKLRAFVHGMIERGEFVEQACGAKKEGGEVKVETGAGVADAEEEEEEEEDGDRKVEEKLTEVLYPTLKTE